MPHPPLDNLLQAAEEAARAAGGLLMAHFGKEQEILGAEEHDIKIALDRRSQDLIEHHLLAAAPGFAIYGEEGLRGDPASPDQWIIDPIDGTVNFFYGIPHFCVSIALRHSGELCLGVIFDPVRNELWSAIKGRQPLLNGRPISVSSRTKISEAVITVGFSKTAAAISKGLPILTRLSNEVKKIRMLGSAALDVAYVATGRLDAYIETQISLWDVAAGIVLVEAAGGAVRLTPHESVPDKFSAVITNGRIDFGV